MSYTKPNLKSKHYDNLFNSLPSLEGKTIAITGTTSGTGYVAANACGKLGAKVLLLNRQSERSVKSYESLKANTPNGDFIRIECDLQNFNSVKESTKNIEESAIEGLDVLCNNAGVMALEDIATIDGYDVQMQTNHLSHFLLVKLLFPLLKKAESLRGEARIINHSSIARKQPSKILKSAYLEKNGGNLGGNGTSIMGGARWLRYNQTKLANAAFTAALHHKLSATNLNIKAIVAHPGLAETDLQTTTVKDGGMGKWITRQMMKLGQSREDGALGILKSIADSSINSGDFVGPGMGGMFSAIKGEAKAYPLESFYDNEEVRNLLWSKSCQAIGQEFSIK